MDSTSTQRDVVRNIKDPKTMADSNCPYCYGRGVNHIILPDQVSNQGIESVPQICSCVVRFLKSNPSLLFEFLKSQGQIH